MYLRKKNSRYGGSVHEGIFEFGVSGEEVGADCGGIVDICKESDVDAKVWRKVREGEGCDRHEMGACW